MQDGIHGFWVAAATPLDSTGQIDVALLGEHANTLFAQGCDGLVLFGTAGEGTSFSAAERIAAERIAPVVILTAFSQRELVERARDAGAMAYLVKPFTKADLVPAIEMAVSRFAEIRALDTEIGTLRERLEVRKLLDRAKGLLQSEHGLTEPEAFRWIQKTSMDRRLTMRKVAEAVIEGSMRVPAETPQPQP